MSAHVTPQEFQEDLNAALAERDPHVVQAAVRRTMERRFPPLAAASVDAYPLPTNVALFLYETTPGHHGEFLRAALGSPQTADYWRRLAALASFACTANDWRTVGELAFAFDCAMTEAGISEEDAEDETNAEAEATHRIAEPNEATPKRLVQAWRKYFHDLATWRSAHFVQVAVGYFQTLPAGFALPPELIYGEMDKGQALSASWPLLRLFWRDHHIAWKEHPEGLAQLEACTNPLLRDLTAQLRRVSGVPSQPSEHQETVAEPFSELAGDELQNFSLLPLATPPPLANPSPPRRLPSKYSRTGRAHFWDAMVHWLRRLVSWPFRRS